MTKFVMAAIAGVGMAMAAQANTVTWTFMENGVNANLGPTSAFLEGGYTISATGYTLGGTQVDLFSKNSGPGETGLGIANPNDVGLDNEIDNAHFVQLDLSEIQAALAAGVGIGSVQLHEDGAIYGSDTAGSIGTELAYVTSNGSINILPWLTGYKYINVGVAQEATLQTANVVLTSLTADMPNVPDGGSTVMLLGMALSGMGLFFRRKTHTA